MDSSNFLDATQVPSGIWLVETEVDVAGLRLNIEQEYTVGARVELYAVADDTAGAVNEFMRYGFNRSEFGSMIDVNASRISYFQRTISIPEGSYGRIGTYTGDGDATSATYEAVTTQGNAADSNIDTRFRLTRVG